MDERYSAPKAALLDGEPSPPWFKGPVLLGGVLSFLAFASLAFVDVLYRYGDAARAAQGAAIVGSFSVLPSALTLVVARFLCRVRRFPAGVAYPLVGVLVGETVALLILDRIAETTDVTGAVVLKHFVTFACVGLGFALVSWVAQRLVPN